MSVDKYRGQAALALGATALVGVGLAARALWGLHEDELALRKDGIDGSALITLQALRRVERMRLVKQAMTFGLAVYLYRSPPTPATRRHTIFVIIAASAIEDLKSFVLQEARLAVQDVERARAKR